jgi:hypothetical protein
MSAEQSHPHTDVPAPEYEAPELVELGNIVELTNGSAQDDTSDLKKWYY